MNPFANDLSKAISRQSMLRKRSAFSKRNDILCDSSK
jgi:hypothetical protein